MDFVIIQLNSEFELWFRISGMWRRVVWYIYFQWFFQLIQAPGLLFSSIIIFHRRFDSLDEWSARRKAATYTQDCTNRINAYTHETSMSLVGFEPMNPASERAKAVHALDRSGTVTGCSLIYTYQNFERFCCLHLQVTSHKLVILIFAVTRIWALLNCSLRMCEQQAHSEPPVHVL
jgi:hypothetical protein